MGIYTVSGDSANLETLRFNEGDVVASVMQNIAVILATPKGSVPMYRDFGLDREFLDMPTPYAEVRMIAPIREAIETWEPRATVRNITFTRENQRLIPHVEVEINGE